MDQAVNNFCHANVASNMMCVEAKGVEGVVHDSLRHFDASMGVMGCCSAADSLSAVDCAVCYFCRTFAFTLP